VKPVVQMDTKSVPLIAKVGLSKVTYMVVVVEIHPHIVTSLLVLQR
jgi:hypothetical protein